MEQHSKTRYGAEQQRGGSSCAMPDDALLPLLPVFEDKCHDALSGRLAGAMGARHFASQPTHNARAALVFEVPTLPRLVISKLRRVTS